MIAQTPVPPYYAVIFSSVKSVEDSNYVDTARKMIELAQISEGYLGMESARSDLGITVSYWDSLEAIKVWKAQTDHQIAQEKGKSLWYQAYKVRIAKVEREYGFEA